MSKTKTPQMNAYDLLEERRKNQCAYLFDAILSKEEINRSLLINCHTNDLPHLWRGKVECFLYVESLAFFTITYKLRKKSKTSHPEWTIKIEDHCQAHREESVKLLTLYVSDFLKAQIISHLCQEESEVENAA